MTLSTTSALCFVLLTSTSVATAATSSFNASSTLLTLDGVACGPVDNFEGGDARTSVVVEPSSGNALPKKHVTGVNYAPIIFDVRFPLPKPVVDAINEFAANRRSPSTLVLATYNQNFQLYGTPLQANNAVLTEVRFPLLDVANAKDVMRATLVFTAGSVQTATVGVPATLSATSVRQSTGTSGFKVHIGTLPTTGLSQVQAFTIKQSSGSAAPEFSNVMLTLVASDLAGWSAWRDSFVINGINDDASEKNASLEFLSSATSSGAPAVVFTLQFSHVGIVRASTIPMPSGAEGVNRFQSEIYYETVSLTGAPTPPLSALPVDSSTIPLSTATVAPTATPTSPVATTPTPTSTVITTTTPVREVAPVATGRVPVSSVGRTATVDQGARDPKDLPRPEGTVRKNYSSITQKTSLQELVIYTTRETLDPIEEFYMKNLTAARWELVSRFENNQAVGSMHQIILNLKNGLRTVAITLTEVKAGGSEISVNLTTKISG